MIHSTNTTNAAGMHSSDEEELQILPLLMLLWSKKMFIAGLMLCGCVLGILVALSKTSVYRADALLQLETKSSGITLSENITDMMSNESEAVTEIEIIKSRMVLGKTVRELNLDITSEVRSIPLLANFFAMAPVSVPNWGWLSSYGLRGEKLKVESLEVKSDFISQPLIVSSIGENRFRIEAPDGSLAEGIYGKTLAHPDGNYKINVSQISARAGVEFKVTKVPELTALNQLRNSLRVTEKGRNSNLLVLTLEDTDVHTARETLDHIARNYVAQNVGRSAEEAEKSLEFLREQLPVVQQDLSAAENELNDFRLKHESINLDLESASVLERMVALDAQISELSLQEAELSRLYTRAHPRYTALLDKRAKLTNEKNSLAGIVQSFPETQQEILKRTRNLEVNQHIYLQLLNKKQELNVLKASTVGSVRMIDSAVASPNAVSPDRPQLVMLFTMLAMGLACGLVFLRMFLERNVDSPEDISKLGVPVYATIPKSTTQEAGAGSGYVVSRDNPSELAVEALRSLRTSLHFGMLENGRGVVSVTGPSPEIGKSFVAANLAYLAAESGSNVLLIDADMRRGTAAQILGVDNNEGLSELLAGRIKLRQAIKSVVLAANSVQGQQNKAPSENSRTLEPELEAVLGSIDLLESSSGTESNASPAGQGQLAVIARGKAPPNPAELLMQDRLPNLLKEVAQSFDLVIVDTPPVLAVTDAMIVGRYADMNLMVVRHNQTGVREMEEVVKAFSVNSVELSGAILNGYDQKNGRFGQYGYAYGYQYQYQSVD